MKRLPLIYNYADPANGDIETRREAQEIAEEESYQREKDKQKERRMGNE